MEYPKPALAVDLALITVTNDSLHCLLKIRPDAEKVGGQWALPGGFVRIDESIEDAARRVLREKVGSCEAYLEQLYTYGAIDRDPRERVVSVTHFALVPDDRLDHAVLNGSDLVLAQIDVNWPGEEGGIAGANSATLGRLSLAFDHAYILGDLVKRLRGKLDYSPIALELLPKLFTLRDAQTIYEAILGKSLTKPAFRRKFLDRGLIKPTGKRETASAFRPAELYTRL